MKLKDLIEQYGEYEVNSKCIVGECAIERIVIDLTKPKPKSVWELKNGDKYFVLYHDGDIAEYKWIGDTSLAESYRDHGNVFLTKEDAEKDSERRKVETLLLKHGGRRWFDGHNHNFRIGLDDYEEHLKVYILMTPTQGTIYFDTKARAEKAISEIGAERIRKALFEVR